MDTRSSSATRTSDQRSTGTSTGEQTFHARNEASFLVNPTQSSSRDSPPPHSQPKERFGVPLRIIHSSASIVSIPSPRPTFPRGMSFDDGLSQWESYADRISMESARVEDELKRMRDERRVAKGSSTASNSVRSANSSVRKTPSRYRRDKNNNPGSLQSTGNENGEGQDQLRRQPTVSSSNTEKMESSFRDFDGVHAEIGSIAEEQDYHDDVGAEVEPSVGEGQEEELIDLQDVGLEKDFAKDNGDDAVRTTPTVQEPPPPRSQSPFPRMGQPVPGMIYYPAPVPRLLNLPKPLSQGLPTNNETRLADMHKISDEYMIPQDLELVNGSATLTLDCILDAAAFTPSDGTSQKPMNNSRGKEAFRRSALQKAECGRRRRTKTPDSFIDVDLDGKDDAGPRSSSESWVSDESRSSSMDSISRILHPSQPLNHESFLADLSAQGPTTLLAELQLRKTQQKNRMKTAQTAFPSGAHTTLLQLDAVAEYQMDIRKGKAVPAFEAYDDTQSGEDDVPLGILFPSADAKSILNAEDDDEPLSQRKKRLQKENERPTLIDLDLGMQTDANGNRDDDEDQPLSRRKKNLQAKTRPDDFASTVLTSLAEVNAPQKPQLKVGNDDAASLSISTKSATDSGQSESIAQRKRRLQAERLARASKPVPETPPSAGAMSQAQYGFQSQLPAPNSTGGLNYAPSVQSGHLMSMSGTSNPYLYPPFNAAMNGTVYPAPATFHHAFAPQAYGGTMPINMFPPFQAPFNQTFPMAPAMPHQFVPGFQRPLVNAQTSTSRQTWSSRR